MKKENNQTLSLFPEPDVLDDELQLEPDVLDLFRERPILKVIESDKNGTYQKTVINVSKGNDAKKG